MGKKVISLSVDEEVYEQYRKLCEERGVILSKQSENFIKEGLKKNNRGK